MTMRIRLVAQAAILAATMTVAGAAQAAPEFKLRWGHYLPNSDFVEVEKKFAETIKERTNGRVEIEITFAGGLGKGNEIMTLAGRGAIDMASVVPGYYADQLLFWRAYQIPFVFDTPAQAMEVSAKAYQELPYFKEELDRMNIRFLFHQPLGAYYLTGPSPDCDTVDALEGKKIRSFGADIPKVHSAVGAVPVTVGVTEVYEALQRGTLDYSFLNPGNILSNKLHEVGKYSCGPIMAITGHMITIGNRTWEKLPEDIQQIFIEEGRKSHQEYAAWVDTHEAKAAKQIEAEGGVIKKFPDSELAKWKKAAPDLLANWVEDMEGRGLGKEAKEVAAYWGTLLNN